RPPPTKLFGIILFQKHGGRGVFQTFPIHGSGITVHFPVSSFFSCSCALFCTRAKLNCFIFNGFRTLCAKPPGVGRGHRFGRSQLPEITKSPAAAASRARYLRPRLDFMIISGQRAKMEVVRPPRGVNSPRTTHHSGRTASTMSRRILLTAFS